MKLSLIISQARSGELKSLSIKDKTDAVIVNYVNLALVALYGRFSLSSKEAIITLQDGKGLYKLDGTDADVEVDGATISEDDVIKILNAFNEDGEVGINNEYDDYGIYTPSYDSVQIPSAVSGNYISIIYKANPVLIEYEEGVTDPTTVNVRLPMSLLEPLLHYVGYRAHGSVDGNIDSENNTHLMRYEASCNKVEQLGLVPSDSLEIDTNTSTRSLLV